MGNVYLTETINALLDNKVKEVGAKTKEGLVHAIFLLALTDKNFLQQAQELNRDYFGELGEQNLEKIEKLIKRLVK